MLKVENYGQIVINGKIDRMDIMNENEKCYFRIIDYKTNKKEFRLSEVKNGINMQMPIYIATICNDLNYSTVDYNL